MLNPPPAAKGRERGQIHHPSFIDSGYRVKGWMTRSLAQVPE